MSLLRNVPWLDVDDTEIPLLSKFLAESDDLGIHRLNWGDLLIFHGDDERLWVLRDSTLDTKLKSGLTVESYLNSLKLPHASSLPPQFYLRIIKC